MNYIRINVKEPQLWEISVLRLLGLDTNFKEMSESNPDNNDWYFGQTVVDLIKTAFVFCENCYLYGCQETLPFAGFPWKQYILKIYCHHLSYKDARKYRSDKIDTIKRKYPALLCVKLNEVFVLKNSNDSMGAL